MPTRVPQRVLPRANGSPLVDSPVHDRHIVEYVPPEPTESTTSTTTPSCNLFVKSASAPAAEAPSPTASFKSTPTSNSLSPSSPRPGLRRQFTTSSFKKQAAATPRRRPTIDFMNHFSKIQAQLATRKKAEGCTLQAESSFLIRWDFLTALALVYTALLTPFEVAFLETPVTMLNPWFMINRFIDLIFIADLVLQFFVVYEEAAHADKQITADVIFAKSEGGFQSTRAVFDKRRIAEHYLKGWFTLDLLSILPSTFDFFPFFLTDSGVAANDAERLSSLKTMRLLRVLRLIKLARLARATRILRRWWSRIAISYAILTLLKCLLAVLLAAHWYSCIFSLQASLQDDPGKSWLGIYGYCDDDATWNPPPYHALRNSNISAFQRQCPDLNDNVGSWYLAAFTWSNLVITGTGGTDAYPSGDSDVETFLVMVLVLFGSLLWTQVLASLCDIATNSDPAMTEYRQTMDDLNRFCRDENLPTGLRRRLREYFMQRRRMTKARASRSVLAKMSPSLQAEVTLRVQAHWLRHIWFLRGAEPQFMVELTQHMVPAVFTPNECPRAKALYVIHKGIVLYRGRVLTSGKIWGEDIIMERDINYLPITARCMTYVEAFTVPRALLFDLLRGFPHTHKLVRKAALKVAFRRTMGRLLAQARAQASAADAAEKGVKEQSHLLEYLLKDATLDGRSATDPLVNFVSYGGAEPSGALGGGPPQNYMSEEASYDGGSVAAAIGQLRAEMASLREGMDLLLAAQAASGRGAALPRAGPLTPVPQYRPPPAQPSHGQGLQAEPEGGPSPPMKEK